jgi:AcrR family transcriptional regulator
MGTPAETNSRQRQKAETRHRILCAAITVFARGGFDAASIASIADSAGVKKALVQYHFPTKDELWRAAAAQLMEGRNERLARFLEAPSADHSDTLKQAFTAVVEHTRANPEWLWFIFHEAAVGSERRDWLIEHFLREDYLLGETFIREAQAAGIVRAGPPLQLLHLISGALTYNLLVAPVTDAATGIDLATDRAIDQQVDVLLAVLSP